MTGTDSHPSSMSYLPPTWIRILLGVVLIVGGLLVLGDLALATLVSALFIGFTAIAVGAFEIVHAFWTKGWGGFIWQILLGILYIAFGYIIVIQPVSGALILTFILAFLLVGSGVIRIVMALRDWGKLGWIMIMSGIFAVVAGVIILTGWPATGIWVLGLLLSVDLISHGVAWLSLGWHQSVQEAA